MGTEELGVLLRVKRPGPRIVQLVYEKGVVVKQYSTQTEAAMAYNAWAAMANGR